MGYTATFNQNICIVNKNQMIVIKSEWTPQRRDKSLLRAERRSCNSNFRVLQVYLRASIECQSLDCDD